MGSRSFIAGLFSGIFLLIAALIVPVKGQHAGQPGRDQKRVVVDSVILSGNKITRDHIIHRELMFRAGDTVTSTAMDTLIRRSRENLLNTSLFNFVEITRSQNSIDTTLLVIRINVTERWYVWPVPIFKLSDRNFNVWWETKDFSRLSYGFYIDWQNFRGRKESLVMKFQYGYDQIYELTYSKPYINKARTIGIGAGGGYWRKRETNFETVENKHQFYKDTVRFAREDIYAFGQFLLRPSIYNSHLLELRYDHHHFSDSLLAQNVHYSVDDAQAVQYLTFRYHLKIDHRDFRQYPLKGYYADFELIKQGLWTFKENTLDNVYLMATFRKYWELHPKVYFATGVNGKVSIGPSQPYFILKGIGYDRDIVRSYEYYVVDARNFGILKNNIKFALIPEKTHEIKFIRTEKFRKIFYALYLNVFFDAGYGAYDQDFGWETNDLQNSLLLGYGAGLDFVTYYDIVVRMEFSVNFLNETGFFLHFRAPI